MTKVTKAELISCVKNNLDFEFSDGRFYVYGLFYKDGNNEICFYIGKGTGDRHRFHLRKSSLDPESSYNPYKVNKILSLKKKNKHPYSSLLFGGLREKDALKIEEFILSSEEIYSKITNILVKNFPLSGKNHPMYGKRHTEETLSKFSKLTDQEIKEIRWLAHDSVLTNKEVANKFDLNISTVSSIKLGDTNSHVKGKIKPSWYSSDFEANLLNRREEESTEIPIQDVKEIRWTCKNSKLTVTEIAEKYGISPTMVSEIKNYKKLSHIRELERPDWINDEIISRAEERTSQYMTGEKNPSFVLTDTEVAEIKWLIKHSNLTLRFISEKYNVFESTISAIKNERARSYIRCSVKPTWYSREYEKQTIREQKLKKFENSKLTKLSNRKVREIKWLLVESDFYQREIAEKYGISVAQVSNIKNGKSRSYVQETMKPTWIDS